ncbi:MAG: DUF4265 domain-containing protein [Fibrobacterota bacterium]|nr:DUF4265 domain-containing protein [Fibrobacterota bacterium]QQS04359.1 MAG: DUF4265 domain-containing protein [Fibrobacterota bacterium]
MFAGRRLDQSPVFEEVLAQSEPEGRFLILRSPGLVQGIAAGDLIMVESEGRFRVLHRGQNLCIQVFFPEDTSGVFEIIEAAREIGCALDGEAPQLLVFTIQVSVGFSTVQRVFNELAQMVPGLEWYYGNVYDALDGVTPLNWWVSE